MTHAEFAARCSNIAMIAAMWSGNILTTEKPLEQMEPKAARRFLSQVQIQLERLIEELNLESLV